MSQWSFHKWLSTNEEKSEKELKGRGHYLFPAQGSITILVGTLRSLFILLHNIYVLNSKYTGSTQPAHIKCDIARVILPTPVHISMECFDYAHLLHDQGFGNIQPMPTCTRSGPTKIVLISGNIFCF